MKRCSVLTTWESKGIIKNLGASVLFFGSGIQRKRKTIGQLIIMPAEP